MNRLSQYSGGHRVLSGLILAVFFGSPHVGLSQDFTEEIAPLFNTYCVTCHGDEDPEADLNLQLGDVDEARSRIDGDPEFWNYVLDAIRTEEMPPEKAKKFPSRSERSQMVEWIGREMFAVNCDIPEPGPFKIHRLNNREYANTLRDLLCLPADLDFTADLPANTRGAGFDNNSDTLTISPVHIEHYVAIAENAVNYAMNIYGEGNEESRDKLNEPSRGFREDFADRAARVRLNIEGFASRAYRRPVTEEEMEELMEFVTLAFTHDGESFDKATSLAMRAAILSPNFLFRFERDSEPDGTGKIFEISEFELASRLSYFLWASMPDEELFEMAAESKLRENLDAVIMRMLQDPKAESLTKDFLGQWLEIRSIEETPGIDSELLTAMKGETEHFFNYIVRENRSIMEFLNSDYTFVNDTLAAHYGIPDVEGDQFQMVQVDPEKRGGIFTQASFLTITSKPLSVKGGETTRRPSPVNRGKWIVENIFNQTIPPPPPNVPELEIDQGKELKGTVRQIFEQHRADPTCAQCHARMDSFGFALDNYDGFGIWREQDNHIDVDASGQIDGVDFNTPKEFRDVLAKRKEQFRKALVEKLFGYALARGVQPSDGCAIDEISMAVERDGDTLSSVIINLVKSFPFQHARGPVILESSIESPTQLTQASN